MDYHGEFIPKGLLSKLSEVLGATDLTLPQMHAAVELTFHFHQLSLKILSTPVSPHLKDALGSFWIRLCNGEASIKDASHLEAVFYAAANNLRIDTVRTSKRRAAIQLGDLEPFTQDPQFPWPSRAAEFLRPWLRSNGYDLIVERSLDGITYEELELRHGKSVSQIRTLLQIQLKDIMRRAHEIEAFILSIPSGFSTGTI